MHQGLVSAYSNDFKPSFKVPYTHFISTIVVAVIVGFVAIANSRIVVVRMKLNGAL